MAFSGACETVVSCALCSTCSACRLASMGGSVTISTFAIRRSSWSLCGRKHAGYSDVEVLTYLYIALDGIRTQLAILDASLAGHTRTLCRCTRTGCTWDSYGRKLSCVDDRRCIYICQHRVNLYVRFRTHATLPPADNMVAMVFKVVSRHVRSAWMSVWCSQDEEKPACRAKSYRRIHVAKSAFPRMSKQDPHMGHVRSLLALYPKFQPHGEAESARVNGS